MNKSLFEYTLKDINILVKMSKYAPTDYNFYPLEDTVLGQRPPPLGTVLEVSVMDASLNRELVIVTSEADSFAIKMTGGNKCVWKKDNEFVTEGVTDGPGKGFL